MLDWIITVGGLILFALVLFFCVRWTDREREVFSNGNGHHLE